MSVFDLLAVLTMASAAAAGWQMGFIHRASSWLAMAVGLAVALALVPPVLGALEGIGAGWLLALAMFMLIAGVAGGQVVGIAIGRRLRGVLRHERHDALDQAAGAAFGVVGVLAAVWLVAPAFEAVSGWPRDQVADSALVSGLERVLGDAPDAFGVLRDAVADNAFPTVFAGDQPAITVGTVPIEVDIDPEAARRAAAATVRIESTACGRGQDGTGFVVADGLVMTNAHVVAGAEDITVVGGGVRAGNAEVVAYDPDRDLAVLRVPGPTATPLELADAETGLVAAVFGHPLGGPLRIAPVRLGERVTATGRDLYDRTDIRRQVYFVAAALEPGDSGAAVVDGRGAVVAVVFAIAPDDAAMAFALTAQEVRAGLSEWDLTTPTSTQDCR